MIWKALITLGIFVGKFLLSLFPSADSGIVTTLTSTFSTIKTMIVSLNYLMPVDVFFFVIGTMLTVELALFLWKAGRWIAQIVTGGLVKSA